MIKKIISGGQTGADRAALDVVLEFRIPHGGRIPRGRRKIQVAARSLLCYWAVRELGLTATELAKRLGLTQPAMSYPFIRGEQIAKERNYNLVS